MKKLICLLLFVLTQHNMLSQKKIISGRIIDNKTEKSIQNVHIYSTKLGEGTITNADGNFYIIVDEKDVLQISCIGYKKKTINLSPNDFENLVIKMNLNVESLDEIILNAKVLSANEIVSKVLKQFKKNHFVEPVHYKFYNRVIRYEKDSTLNVIEEYTGIIKQNWLHLTKYSIEKGRIKYLTKDSINKLKNHRVISMDKMFIDNIYKYREDYIGKKALKKYKYELLGVTNILARNCYKISFITDEMTYYKKGELYIDMKDFAVIRKVLRDNDNQILNDITFKKENNKWYLKKSEDYHCYDNDITGYRVTLYNFIKTVDSHLDFIALSSRDFSLDFTGNFNDKFWGNKNFILLPKWIKKQLK